jgi:hypothetical protein
MRQVHISQFLRSVAVVAFMASASVVVAISNGSSAVAATTTARSTAHVSWPVKPSVNPTCGSVPGGDSVCIEAYPTYLKLTWKPIHVPSAETLSLTAFTNTGKLFPIPRGSYDFMIKANSKPGIVHVKPGAEYFGSASMFCLKCSTTKQEKFYMVVGTETNYIVNQVLNGAQVGVPYSVTLRATGGGPYTWRQLKAVPGLSFDTSTGVLSGTPTQAGTFTFSAEATNQYGLIAKTSLSQKVAA